MNAPGVPFPDGFHPVKLNQALLMQSEQKLGDKERITGRFLIDQAAERFKTAFMRAEGVGHQVPQVGERQW